MNHKKSPRNTLSLAGTIDKVWNTSIWLPAVIVGIIGFCLYVQTLPFGYVLDDKLFITQNDYVQRGIAAFPDLVGRHSMAGSTGEFNQGRYRPIPLLMFALEFQLSPNNPRVSHGINIVLYACSSALLVAVMLVLCGKQYRPIVLLTALLWVTHPTHTEVVANIKSRDILLGALFSLLSLWYLLRYIHRHPRLHYIVFAALATACAMLSQEGSIVFVAFIPLCLYFFCTISWRKIILLTLPLGASAVLCLILRAAIIGETDTQWQTLLVNNPFAGLSWLQSLPTKIVILGRYLFLVWFPATLVHDYGYKQIPIYSLTHWQVLLSAALYGGIVVYSIITFKRRNIVAFCGLSYCILLAVASNLFLYYGMPMSDRMLYMAVLPAMMAGVVLLTNVAPMRFVYSIGGVIVCLFVLRTITRNPDWESDFTLNRADILHSPDCLRMRVNYATLLMDEASKRLSDTLRVQKLTSEALLQLRAAHHLDSLHYAPTYAVLATYHSDFASRLDSAHYYWTRARAIDSLTLHYQVRELYVQAMLQSQRGNTDSAITLYRQTLPYFANLKTQSPMLISGIYEKIYVKLGLAYSNKQDFRNALGYFEQALALNPANTTTAQNVTMSKFNNAMQQARHAQQENKLDSTIGFLQEALLYKIRQDVVYAEIGAIYLQRQQFDKAREMYTLAERENPQDPVIRRALEFLRSINR